MNLFNVFRTPVRWINRLPLWCLGRVWVWGHGLRAPTFDRWLCLWLHRLGLMGKADRAFLQAHLQPGMTVVDIGANQGLYTLFFSDRVGPDGRVLAFEPDPLLYGALEKNVAANAAGNVKPYHLALGSTTGTMTLYRSLLNSGDNRLAADRHGKNSREAVAIQVVRLDDVLAGDRIDFIKIDVQGWEMEVFRGMEAFLNDAYDGPRAIYFEYWPQGLRDAGSDPLELLTYLARKGFRLSIASGVSAIIIEDLPAFVRSVEAGTYINLYASRPG